MTGLQVGAASGGLIALSLVLWAMFFGAAAEKVVDGKKVPLSNLRSLVCLVLLAAAFSSCGASCGVWM